MPEVGRLEPADDEASHGRTCGAGAKVITVTRPGSPLVEQALDVGVPGPSPPDVVGDALTDDR